MLILKEYSIVAMKIILAPRRLRQDDMKVKDSLIFTLRPCLRQRNQQNSPLKCVCVCEHAHETAVIVSMSGAAAVLALWFTAR